ncbi:MAG: tetratricopeptide repeat protein [Armatimonadota bacterium]
MKHTVVYFLLGVLLLSGNTVFSAPEPVKPADIAAKARLAVVAIISYDAAGKKLSQGSGFIAKDDGTVVTCWHVISGASSVKVTLKNKSVITSNGVLAWDGARDFAIIKITGKNLPVIALGDSDNIRKNDKVQAVNSSGTVLSTDGMITGVRMLPRAPILIQTTVAVKPDNSGSPILNSEGQVIGVGASLCTGPQTYNYVVPINTIKAKLAAGGKVTPYANFAKENFNSSAEGLFLKGILTLPDATKTPEAKKKFEQAMELFKLAIDKRKAYPEAHFYVGYCLGELGRSEDAIKSFQQVIQIKPDYAEAHFGLGLAQVNLGWNQDAVESFKEAIRIKPDYADAYYNLGLAYVNLGWSAESIESFKQATKVNPDYVEAYYNLGVAYVQENRNTDAAENFKQVIRLNPDQPQAQFGLGVVYINLEKNQEAADTFKQAIRVKPDYAEAHFGLGVAYLNLEKNPEAVESFKQSIRIKPEDADAHYNLGLAYDKLGMKKEALESLKQAVKLRPEHAEAHYNLGVIYTSQDDRGSALDEYKILKDQDAVMAEKLFKLIYP